ncbi:hypothetical protein R6Q57_023778 [Mikania cordata]
MEANDDGDTMIMGAMTTHIKGKRTKRRRPSPTLTLTLASTSSTTSETSAPPNHNGFFQMPNTTTSIDFTNIFQDNHTMITNDQDIANCLMLLAQGHQPLARLSSNMDMPMVMPVQSRSYVYECKTCDRGFTSFQALGGHRASHNKCKDVHDLATNKTLLCNPSGSTKGPKVHACSICGSEFTSGQALGGHMRRHRSITMATTSMAATTCNTSIRIPVSKKHKTMLPLDLNLPAPIDDDQCDEIDDSFVSNNQIIIFSAPALVDCHFDQIT